MGQAKSDMVARRWPLLLPAAAAVILLGCIEHILIGEGNGEAGLGVSPAVEGGQGGTSSEAGQGGTPDAQSEGDVAPPDADAQTPAQSCGAASCSAPAQCCYLTAKCFDPAAEPEACPIPPPDGEPGTPCGADAHCGAGEYCRNDNGYMCMGKGRCTPMTWATCSSFEGNITCGCDGSSISALDGCMTGARVLYLRVPAPCGAPNSIGQQNFCGNDSAWCPAGQQCCDITGLCYDPALPELCTFPPDGTYLPCVSDDYCPNSLSFCQGPTCGAPGACVPNAWECDGPVQEVCGCDGNTYMNAKCAAHSLVAIDHAGPCGDSGVGP